MAIDLDTVDKIVRIRVPGLDVPVFTGLDDDAKGETIRKFLLRVIRDLRFTGKKGMGEKMDDMMSLIDGKGNILVMEFLDYHCILDMDDTTVDDFQWEIVRGERETFLRCKLTIANRELIELERVHVITMEWLRKKYLA